MESSQKIKLIVSDIDGTLVDSVHKNFEISPAVLKAVTDAADNGIKFALATGRMYRSASRYAAALGLSTPVICYNGALVKNGDEIISSCFLPNATAVKLLDFAFSRHLYIQLYHDDELYFAKEEEKARIYQQAARIAGRAVGEDGLRELAKHGNLPKMLAIVGSDEPTEPVINEINRQFAGEIFAMESGPRYIELVLPTVSKGAAVASLAAYHGITAAETMCIGDAQNDIPMIQFAGVGVAMGNSPQSVKDAARFATDTAQNDGLAKAIYKFALN